MDELLAELSKVSNELVDSHKAGERGLVIDELEERYYEILRAIDNTGKVENKP